MAVTKSSSFQPGVYLLTNGKCDSVLDLSGGDNKSIIGFPLHGFENQQWEFEPLGAGWSIKSVSAGLYMSTEFTTCSKSEGGSGNGWQVVASVYPMAWLVEVISEGIVRIFWPGTRYVFTLAREGHSTPGTKLELSTLSPPPLAHQIWRTERLRALPTPGPTSRSDSTLTPTPTTNPDPKLTVSSPDADPLCSDDDGTGEATVTTTTTTTTLPHVSGTGEAAQTTVTTVITTTVVTRVLPAPVLSVGEVDEVECLG